MGKTIALLLAAVLILVSASFVVKANAKGASKSEPTKTETIKKDSRPLEGKTIVIDPGHGGKDVGATGQSGLHEKAATLLTAQNIQRELQEQTGASVILTRDKDVSVSLPERVEVARNHDADLYISVHYDAFTTSDVAGITTYYTKSEDRPAAQIIHDQLFKQDVDTRDRGVEQGDYHVLRENASPSILLELGYISNRQDEQRIQSAEFQSKASKAIVEGTIAYFQGHHGTGE